LKPADLRPLVSLIPSVATVLGFVIALQLLLPPLRVPSYIVPLPSSVLSLLLSSRIPWETHALVTLYEATFGFGLAVAFGTALAILITLSGLARKIVEPLLVAAQVMPKLAFVPVLFLWLGFNAVPRVLTVFLVCLFPIVIDTSAGLARADVDLLDLVKPFTSSRLTFLEKVQFPMALPSFFSGLKVSVTLAMLGAIVAEFIASSQGLGYLIISAETQLNTTLAFASATLLVLMGFLLYGMVLALERLAIPWARS